jgi:hypothetical protein
VSNGRAIGDDDLMAVEIVESNQFYVSRWVVLKSGWVEYLPTFQLPELVQFRILNS